MHDCLGFTKPPASHIRSLLLLAVLVAHACERPHSAAQLQHFAGKSAVQAITRAIAVRNDAAQLRIRELATLHGLFSTLDDSPSAFA